MTIALIAALARILCRMREGRRHRAARVEISAFSSHELRDIGLSHAEALPGPRRDSSLGSID
jgi:uncharacterized protein YjiS (DUF1127 family)